jgi:hypothetical protein
VGFRSLSNSSCSFRLCSRVVLYSLRGRPCFQHCIEGTRPFDQEEPTAHLRLRHACKFEFLQRSPLPHRPLADRVFSRQARPLKHRREGKGPRAEKALSGDAGEQAGAELVYRTGISRNAARRGGRNANRFRDSTGIGNLRSAPKLFPSW